MVARVRAGFTLVEMVVVVAIIALIVSIAVPNFLTQLRRAKLVKSQAKISSLNMAIAQFRTDVGRYPRQGMLIQELTQQGTAGSIRWNGPYLTLDADDRNTVQPNVAEPFQKFLKRAVIYVMNENAQLVDPSPNYSPTQPVASKNIIGEPGFADGHGRRVVYIPGQYYNTNTRQGDPSKGWANYYSIPYFGAVVAGNQQYSNINFGSESDFFQLISAGEDGKLLCVDVKETTFGTPGLRIVPLIWNNGINDDNGGGPIRVTDPAGPDSADDLFPRAGFAEDDVVNW